MSEYVKKQALLGFLDVSIEGVPCKHISIELLKEKIQSGAFDPKDDLDEIIRKNHSLAVKMKVRTLELEDEIQRLRAATIKLHETLNTYWQGDCEKADVVAVQSKLCDVLGADRDVRCEKRMDMTYYIRNKDTGEDIVIKEISIEEGLVYTADGKTLRLVEVIENYEFRYDIW